MSDGIPSPNPDFPIPIKNVTGNANVKIQNKNLAWNGWAQDFVTRINDSSLASLTTKNGKNCLKFDRIAGYGSYDTKYLFKTNWKENTQYTISCDLFVEGSNAFANIGIVYTDGTTSDSRYNRTINNWKNYSMTSAENKTIKYLRAEYFAGINYIDLDTFMVEENTTVTSYVPHQEQNYAFTFAEGQRGMQGTTLEDDGIHNEYKQKIFDGSNDESWNLQGINANGIANFYIGLSDYSGRSQNLALVNYFTPQTTPIAQTTEEGFYLVSAKTLYIRIKSSIASTVAEFRTWLSTHNLLVEYELAESELENNIIPYNETQQAQYNDIEANASSYDDITYITSTSDELGFDINVVGLEKSVNQVLGGSY